MLRNDSFHLIRIEGEPYILPVGQMVADHMRGVKINETGAFIWESIKEELSDEELYDRCFNYFEADDDEKCEVKGGVDDFISLLNSRGMILKDEPFDDVIEDDKKESGNDISINAEDINFAADDRSDLIKSVVIADISISFYGDKESLTDKFDAFAVNDYNGKPDIRIEITNDSPESIKGKDIIKDAPVETKECTDRYILRFPESTKIIECHLSKTGDLARFYTDKDLDDAEKELLFHAIRTVFLYKALSKGIAAVHSASILYRNKAWLFSASAGTGKSTHAALWKKLFDVSYINGDLNLIGMKDGRATVFGLPWCGTSETFDTEEHELGGVVLLKRNLHNYADDLKEDEKQLFIQQRIISPTWDYKMLEKQYEIVGSVVKSGICVARLNCTADDEAAMVMKQYIDNKLNSDKVM